MARFKKGDRINIPILGGEFDVDGLSPSGVDYTLKSVRAGVISLHNASSVDAIAHIVSSAPAPSSQGYQPPVPKYGVGDTLLYKSVIDEAELRVTGVNLAISEYLVEVLKVHLPSKNLSPGMILHLSLFVVDNSSSYTLLPRTSAPSSPPVSRLSCSSSKYKVGDFVHYNGRQFMVAAVDLSLGEYHLEDSGPTSWTFDISDVDRNATPVPPPASAPPRFKKGDHVSYNGSNFSISGTDSGGTRYAMRDVVSGILWYYPVSAVDASAVRNQTQPQASAQPGSNKYKLGDRILWDAGFGCKIVYEVTLLGNTSYDLRVVHINYEAKRTFPQLRVGMVETQHYSVVDGSDQATLYREPATKSSPDIKACSCPMDKLMMNGCTCGAIRRYS